MDSRVGQQALQMEIQRVTPTEFASFFERQCNHVYNSVGFAELNRHKCEDVHYLVFRDAKVRFGMILGQKGFRLLSPFSAPFGGFLANRRQSLEEIDQAVALLANYGHARQLDIHVTLPPAIYDADWAKYASAMMRAGRLVYADINYHYDLSLFDKFEQYLSGNARNKYRNSLRYPFVTQELDACREEDVSRAYTIIKANRQSHGYPLRMTLDDVISTAPVVGAMFLVMTLGEQDVAAAQIHRVTDTIAQVVYWGDMPGFADMRAMNRFTHDVLDFCHRRGFTRLDIGPSSEEGVPSYGLCEFKETLGCVSTLKYRFQL